MTIIVLRGSDAGTVETYAEVVISEVPLVITMVLTGKTATELVVTKLALLGEMVVIGSTDAMLVEVLDEREPVDDPKGSTVTVMTVGVEKDVLLVEIGSTVAVSLAGIKVVVMVMGPE